MAAIRVNGDLIRAIDLCFEDTADYVSLIEYWALHEVEGLCENAEIEKRLITLISNFARTPEAIELKFAAILDGEYRPIKIEKV